MLGRNWFESVFGFSEKDYDTTREYFSVEETMNGEIIIETKQLSKQKRRRFHAGRFEAPTLRELRTRWQQEQQQQQQQQARTAEPTLTSLTFRHIAADVGELHRSVENQGSVFQAASQFNCLEMISPQACPEDGIARYVLDRTQGPVCALACPAGTLYRNYFWNGTGQGGRGGHQMDLLQDFGALVQNTNNKNNNNNKPLYWNMKNGYALPVTKSSIRELRYNVFEQLGNDRERALETLRVGIQWDTQVGGDDFNHRVTQVYCSAVPIGYDRTSSYRDWEPFARLVLDAAYEATFLTAILLLSSHCRSSRRNGPSSLTDDDDDTTSASSYPPRVKLYLTKLGGGVFANRDEWIVDAIVRCLTKFKDEPLDVMLVHYGSIDLYYSRRMT